VLVVVGTDDVVVVLLTVVDVVDVGGTVVVVEGVSVDPIGRTRLSRGAWP